MEGGSDISLEQAQRQKLLSKEPGCIDKVRTTGERLQQMTTTDADPHDAERGPPVELADTAEDGGLGWVVVASSAVNLGIVGGHFMSFGLLYPAISEHYNVAYGVSGWVGSFSQSIIHFFGKNIDSVSSAILSMNSLFWSLHN